MRLETLKCVFEAYASEFYSVAIHGVKNVPGEYVFNTMYS